MAFELEDGTIANPFDFCNRVLDASQIYVNFAVKEYNSEIHHQHLQGLTAKKVCSLKIALYTGMLYAKVLN